MKLHSFPKSSTGALLQSLQAMGRGCVCKAIGMRNRAAHASATATCLPLLEQAGIVLVSTEAPVQALPPHGRSAAEALVEVGRAWARRGLVDHGACLKKRVTACGLSGV